MSNDFFIGLAQVVGSAILFFALGAIFGLQVQGNALFEDCVTKQEMTLEGHDFTCALKEPKP